MNIAVNTRFLIEGKLEGIGWFTFETLKRIVLAHPEHTFYFFFDRNYSNKFIFADNVKPVIVPPKARHPILWKFWYEFQITRLLKSINADVFVSPDGFLSTKSDIPQLAVIHDINFYHNPADLPSGIAKYLNKWFPLFAKKAKRIATVSEFSRNDISQNYSIPLSKIDVVFNGASDEFEPLPDASKKIIREKFTQGEDYFIFIGALNPRKNIARLLLAFDDFKKKTGSPMKLVVVGEMMFLPQGIKKALNSIQHRDDVIFTGRLSDKELRYILASAFALTFVSYFEGFGIPLLEALKCDVPVLSSNCTSLPEIGGDAALYVDPFSVEAISTGMSDLYNNEDLRERLIENGKQQRDRFTWEKTAEALWLSIEKTLVL